MLDLYLYSFIVPSVNILVLAKEASERKLIETSKYNQMFKNFQTRSIDYIQEKDNIEDFISMKQKRMNSIFLEKSSKFFESQSFSESKGNHSKEKDFDPIFYENSDQEIPLSPFEIIENSPKFMKFEDLDNPKEKEENKSRLLGYIRMYSKGQGNVEDPVKLYLEFLNGEDMSDISESSEEYSEETSDSDMSEDKI